MLSFSKFSLLSLLISLCLFTSTITHSEAFRELDWAEMMPEGWLPPEWNSDEWGDDSGEDMAFELSAAVKQADVYQEPAPTVAKLDKLKVKIPGYVLPLKYDETGVYEFLLVPYLGACIHVPPPPENQMIYVSLKEKYPSTELFEPVWVTGELRVEHSETQYATAAYTIKSGSAVKYEY